MVSVGDKCKGCGAKAARGAAGREAHVSFSHAAECKFLVTRTHKRTGAFPLDGGGDDARSVVA